MKNKLTLVGILFSLGVISMVPKLSTYIQNGNVKAAGVELSIIPAGKTVSVGDDVKLEIRAKTNSRKLTAVDLQINYDKDLLLAKSISPSSLLPVVLAGGTVSEGVGKIVVGCKPSKPLDDVGAVAYIEFTAIKEGEAQITLSSSTQIAVIGMQTNALDVATPASLKIIPKVDSCQDFCKNVKNSSGEKPGWCAFKPLNCSVSGGTHVSDGDKYCDASRPSCCCK